MILVTGGTGYIGSHVVVELQQAGYDVAIIDNLCNSQASVIDSISQITQKKPLFFQGGIGDKHFLTEVFSQLPVQAVIHCAGLKAVGESVQKPLAYYENNVYGTLCLCQVMQTFGVKRMVFSSSATVYGAEAETPYREIMPRGEPASPYGTSKAMVEKVLEDLHASDNEWSITLLRYFNPVGAHPSGLIGESPQGTPNNLMPYLSQVAVGKRPELAIYGNDYPTPDGTCIRDYLHVVDLAVGHLKALETLKAPGVYHYNLGTGQGASVLEMVQAFMQATGINVAYRFEPRRQGDLPAFWASAEKAKQDLGWAAQKTLEEMMKDTWRWECQSIRG